MPSSEVFRDCCPGCLEPIVQSHIPFCNRCGTPLGPAASLDPINAIRSQGEMFRRGVRQPSITVIIGMWLILLPPLASATLLILHLGLRLHFVPSIFLGFALPSAILYKTTRNYLKRRKISVASESKVLNFSLKEKNNG